MTVERLRNIAISLKCAADPSFFQARLECLKKAYNGAGPDWMASPLRKIISWFLRTFAVAVLIHDWDYDNSNGTVTDFARANIRFYQNCIILINAKYNHWWLTPIKYYATGKAGLAYLSVEDFGWVAWQDGFFNKQHRRK